MKSYLDDPDAIRATARIIYGREHGICNNRSGGMASACWCWAAGPGGSHLPCPPIAEPTPEPAPEPPISNHRLTDPTPVPYRVLP